MPVLRERISSDVPRPFVWRGQGPPGEQGLRYACGMTSTDEFAALQRTVRQLRGGLAVVAVVAAVSVGLVAQQRLSVPDSVEVKSGSRTARLTPEGLVITLDGDPRVVIDAHSGVVVRDSVGRVARLNAEQGPPSAAAHVASTPRER